MTQVRLAAPRHWLAVAVVLAGVSCGASEEVALDLIPLPRSMSATGGNLELSDQARIVCAAADQAIAEQLAAVLRRSTGYSFAIVDSNPAAGDIVLRRDTALVALGPEGYRLEVGDRVDLTAPEPAGLFYGVQTLRQLLPAAVEAPSPVAGVAWRLPRVVIEDQPRFPYRGFMLDVARHFFSVEVVLRLVDLAAYHKLNVLHLHLTDDQGWRIEIDSWPRLTTIGGSTQVGGGPGGFFTKADYAEIVAYAAERFVTVVPEIDMPGHCNAALASYGELNPSGEPTELYTGTEVGFSSLWVDGEVTMSFVADVLSEVAAMTPGPYLHIGGDEAAATSTSEYIDFITQAAAIVADHGKILIGWEEIEAAEPDPAFLAQFWLTEREARGAVTAGGRLIASPAIYAYLDMKYDAWTPVGTNWAGFLDVDKAYQWDPVLSGLVEDDYSGIEAPLFTEWVTSPAEIDYLTFPRLAGYAEIAWSARDGRSWDDYRRRLASHAARLDALGVDYYRSPVIDWPE